MRAMPGCSSRAKSLGLAFEARAARAAQVGGVEDLDRDPSARSLCLRFVDDAHAADAEQADDAIRADALGRAGGPAAQRCVERLASGRPPGQRQRFAVGVEQELDVPAQRVVVGAGSVEVGCALAFGQPARVREQVGEFLVAALGGHRPGSVRRRTVNHAFAIRQSCSTVVRPTPSDPATSRIVMPPK